MLQPSRGPDEVFTEYLLPLEENLLETFINDPRIRAAGNKSNCSVELTKRILNRKISGFKWIKYSIVRITGPDDGAIRQCNSMIERAYPSYKRRKEYVRRAPIVIYTTEFTPDNSNLYFPKQRTGGTIPLCGDVELKSPFDRSEDRSQRMVEDSPWKTSQLEHAGVYTPQTEGNEVQFEHYKSLRDLTSRDENRCYSSNESGDHGQGFLYSNRSGTVRAKSEVGHHESIGKSVSKYMRNIAFGSMGDILLPCSYDTSEYPSTAVQCRPTVDCNGFPDVNVPYYDIDHQESNQANADPSITERFTQNSQNEQYTLHSNMSNPGTHPTNLSSPMFCHIALSPTRNTVPLQRRDTCCSTSEAPVRLSPSGHSYHNEASYAPSAGMSTSYAIAETISRDPNTQSVLEPCEEELENPYYNPECEKLHDLYYNQSGSQHLPLHAYDDQEVYQYGDQPTTQFIPNGYSSIQSQSHYPFMNPADQPIIAKEYPENNNDIYPNDNILMEQLGSGGTSHNNSILNRLPPVHTDPVILMLDGPEIIMSGNTALSLKPDVGGIINLDLNSAHYRISISGDNNSVPTFQVHDQHQYITTDPNEVQVIF